VYDEVLGRIGTSQGNVETHRRPKRGWSGSEDFGSSDFWHPEEWEREREREREADGTTCTDSFSPLVPCLRLITPPHQGASVQSIPAPTAPCIPTGPSALSGMNTAAEELALALGKAESCKFNTRTCSCLAQVLSGAAKIISSRTFDLYDLLELPSKSGLPLETTSVLNEICMARILPLVLDLHYKEHYLTLNMLKTQRRITSTAKLASSS
jgi:hypothetical protein